MTTPIVVIAAALLAWSPAGDNQRQARENPEIDIVWSGPQAIEAPAMEAWSGQFHRELYPVLKAWTRLRKRMQGDLPARFDRQCAELGTSLEAIDRTVVFPVPDLLIDLYVRRLLLHLDAAFHACSRDELFNVVYRLDEAGAALGETRWLLAQQGLGP